MKGMVHGKLYHRTKGPRSEAKGQLQMKTLSGRDSQVVINELASGEKLLWCNRPDAARAARSTMAIFLFAIPWTAFAIFWITMAAMGVSKSPQQAGPFILFPLFGLPFVLIGLSMLSSPLFAFWKAQKTFYGVTNRRLIIVIADRNKVVQSYELENLANPRRSEYGERGDLTWFTNQDVPVVMQNTFSRTPTAVPNTVAFLGIENPRDVERLIEQQIQAIKAEKQ